MGYLALDETAALAVTPFMAANYVHTTPRAKVDRRVQRLAQRPSWPLPFSRWCLTRPWNVLAMGLMVGTVMHWQGVELRGLLHLGRVGWLLVPMLVGAGGNLINDYFDVREDRINKPDKALVGRTVKRRVVMVTHWGFTVAALAWRHGCRRRSRPCVLS